MRPSCYTVPGLGDGCVCRQATAGHQGWLLLGRYREIRAALEGVTARLFAGFPPEDLATAGRVLSIITTAPTPSWPILNYPGRGGAIRMTERKPPEISFASWIDQQIDEAAERGAFDNLPGAGKPLPKRAQADDGQAWLRDYLRREGVSAEELLPTPLRLRKEVERLTGTVQDLRSEQEVREVVAGLNQRILAWRRIPEGPPVYLPLVNAETMVARWRDAHPGPSFPAQAGSPAPDVPSPRPRWWRRLGRRRE